MVTTNAFKLARGAKIFRLGAVILVASLLIGSSPTLDPTEGQPDSRLAADKFTADGGLVVARKLCVTCHLIGEPAVGPLPADVPSFVQIAGRPQQTFSKISGWLAAPHAPMPDPHLTRQEIGDLATYIMSLRKEQ